MTTPINQSELEKAEELLRQIKERNMGGLDGSPAEKEYHLAVEALHCLNRYKSHLATLQKTVESGDKERQVRLQLSHPTIHLEYYKWLETNKNTDFWKSRCSFEVFRAIAMWVWTESRQEAREAIDKSRRKEG